MSDLKLYLLNVFSLTVSFTDIELGLKIILLIISIGYTISKWIYFKTKENVEDK
jgi:hypothetical protein